MSYRLAISQKSRRVARALARVQRAVQIAYANSGMTQQEIANILDVDRSVINRRLAGKANLTIRSLAELSHALNKELVVEFREFDRHRLTNSPPIQFSKARSGMNVQLRPVYAANVSKSPAVQFKATATTTAPELPRSASSAATGSDMMMAKA